MEPCIQCGQITDDLFGAGLCIHCHTVQKNGAGPDNLSGDPPDIAANPPLNPLDQQPDDLANFGDGVPSVNNDGLPWE